MENEPPPFEIDPQELADLLQSPPPDLRLIDCREEDEFQICRLPEAELMPLSRFPDLVERLDAFRSSLLIVYCHHGMRSARATDYLRALGFHKTRSLAGGIDRWATEISPETPRY